MTRGRDKGGDKRKKEDEDHISVLFQLFTLNIIKLLTTYDKGTPSYSPPNIPHNCRMRIRKKKRKSKGASGQMKEGEDLTSPPSLHKITYTMKISTTRTKIPDVACTTHSFQLPHEDEG